MAGEGMAVVNFDPPANDGGSPITGYTVTSNPGGISATGSGSPISVTGLTNGMSHTFTVTATNLSGTSLASFPSNSVIPQALQFTATAVPGATLTHIAVASDGTVWGVDGTNTIRPRLGIDSANPSGTSWGTLAGPATMREVALRDANAAWGLDSTDQVWYWNGSSWQSVIGTLAHISVATDGSVWGTQASGSIYQRAGTGSTPTGTGWVNLLGSLKQLAVRDANAFWGVNSSNGVWYWQSGFQGVAGALTQISVASDGSAWGVDGSNTINRRTGISAAAPTGTGWATLSGAAAQVAVRNSYAAWSIDGSGNVSYWARSGFVPSAPSAPSNPVATAGSGQAAVSFSAPALDGGSFITGYTVTSNPGGITAGGTASPITITGLTNGVSYTFTVTATNDVGTSLPSSPSNAVTPALPPDAPLNVSAMAGESMAVVNFDPPGDDGGSAVTSYTVTSSPGSITASGAASPITVTGLTNGVSYTFTVTATNGIGTGPASAPSIAVTPQALEFTSTAVPGVTLTHIAVASDGTVWGVDGTNTIRQRLGISGATPTGTSWGTLAGPAMMKEVSVRNANAAWGIDTTELIWYWNGSSWQPVAGPLAHISVAVDGSVWGTQASGGIYQRAGTGSTPTGTGWVQLAGSLKQLAVRNASAFWGVNSVNAVWYWQSGFQGVAGASLGQISVASDGSAWGVDGSNNITRRTGISPTVPTGTGWASFAGPAVQVAVRHAYAAWSIDGSGNVSYWARSGFVPSAPSAPSNAAATAGSGQAAISFSAPALDGGSFITGYTVTSNPGGITASGTASPITVAGLTNGVSYTFTVTATNDVGTSLPSSPSNAVTPALPPDAPLNVSAMAGESMAVVNFDPPANDGGSAVTSYTVTSSPEGITASGAASPITVTGLTNGVSYTFTVTATNGIGTGPASAPSNAVTPQALEFTSTAVPGVTLTHIAVASDGTVWGVDGAGAIRPRLGISGATPSGTSWGTLAGPATMKEVSVRNANAAWGIDTTDLIWYWNGISWQSVPGSLAHISVAVDGSVWGTQASGSIYQRTGTSSTQTGTGWVNLAGSLKQLAVRNTSAFWGVTSVNGVWYWQSGFQGVAGALTQISAASDGSAWGVDGSNTINRRTGISAAAPTGTGWATLSGAAAQVAVRNSYAAWSIDGSGNVSYWARSGFVPSAPSAPSNPVATAGSGQAAVSFSAPALDGGSFITGYTVTSNPGGITASGTASPITVAGLTNGVSYTFTVTATNDVGTSLPSSPSNAVTPALVPDVVPDPFDFTAQTGVLPSTTATSDPVLIAGINTTASWTATGGQACASSGNGCGCDVSAWAADGTIGNNQYLCARHTSSGSFSTAVNTVVNVGGVQGTFTSTTQAADATPNGFSFVDQTGVPLSTQITSTAVQITGINTTTNWTAAGGQACASSGNNCNCDVSVWGASGTVGNNQYLCARHTSSASFSTAVDTTVDVGGVQDTFTSTTLAADATPNGFSFADQTGVGLGAQVTSAPVQITGINTTASWTATGGQACVSSANNCNCDVAAWSASGTVNDNQYLCVRHISSASFGMAVDTLVNVGGMQDTFTSTTLPADTTPNAFSFADQTGVALASQATSAPVQITGINTAANWGATGGHACASSGNNCNCDVSAWGASGTVGNDQYVCARHTSSASFSTVVDTIVDVGGVQDTFTSTTLAADATPNGFSFVDQNGVALGAQITSAPVQITGINTTASWTATGGQACASSGNNCNCDVSPWAASGTVGNNQYLCARHSSSAVPAASTDTVVTVGGIADTFTSTTVPPDTTPNAFSFTDQTGVSLSMQVTSAPVQIAGVNLATPWTASGGQACASSGNSCACDVAAWGAGGIVSNNQHLCVRHASSASFSTAVITVVNVGGVQGTFTSTTLAADTTPDEFSFVDQAGVGLGAQVTSAPVRITGINTTANWMATGGEACASSGNNCNCDVAAWAGAGTVGNNQYVCARHTSATTFATATGNAFTIGGASDTFSSTTLAAVTVYSGSTGSGIANVVLSGGGNCGFTSSQFVPVSNVPAPPPPGLVFPQRLFDFTLGGGCTPGSTVTLTITYPQSLPPDSQYWKYGPTPHDANPHWYVMPAIIAGNTATFSITDGGLGDDDLAANGTIVDQGGPGVEAPPPVIPTLNGAALALLSVLLGVFGWVARGRRTRC